MIIIFIIFIAFLFVLVNILVRVRKGFDEEKSMYEGASEEQDRDRQMFI